MTVRPVVWAAVAGGVAGLVGGFVGGAVITSLALPQELPEGPAVPATPSVPAPPSATAVLRANEFILLDAAGRVRARLGPCEKPVLEGTEGEDAWPPMLRFFDPEGREMVRLGTNAGGAAGLSLYRVPTRQGVPLPAVRGFVSTRTVEVGAPMRGKRVGPDIILTVYPSWTRWSASDSARALRRNRGY